MRGDLRLEPRIEAHTLTNPVRPSLPPMRTDLAGGAIMNLPRCMRPS